MNIPVSEIEKIRIEPAKPYKFRPKLLESTDAKGNLGLNAILTYQYLERNKWVKRDIRIEVEPGLDTNGHIPYAYQFIPPLERKLSNPRIPSTRTFPIIRIVAAPGVNIYLPKFDKRNPSQKDPLVKIFRVQDISQVPPLGRDIRENDYVGKSWIDPDPTSKLVYPPEHHVRVETKRNGVDIVQDMFFTRYVIRVKSSGRNSGIDRFLYKFVKRSNRVVLIVMATKQVEIEIHETQIKPFHVPKHFFNNGLNPLLDDRKLQIEYLPVPNLFAFNILAPYFYLDNFPWIPKGHIVERSTAIPIHYRPEPSSHDLISLAIIDAIIGFIPVIGDLYDLAQFVYGVSTGTDVHGVNVSEGELFIMGLCVMLPFISIGMVKSFAKGGKALQELGPKGDIVAELSDGMKLNTDGWNLLNEASNLIAQGKKLPDTLIIEIMDKVQLPPHKILSMDDLLDASKSGFNHPTRLRELYQGYAAQQLKKGDKVAPPDQWARNQRHGEANDILLFLLGTDFRKRPKAPSQGKFSTINAADVIRPTSLDDARLTQLIKEILKEPALLLRKIPAEKIVNGKIDKELFDTIKGNVGEIMAKEYKNTLIAAREAIHGKGQVELFENVTIVINKTKDGKFTNEFWEFTDGIIGGFNKDGDFVIKDIIEIKAGDAVANKVQKQIFDWVEDNITDGARIRLPDGREFDYFPTDQNVKRVIGLANAKRHVINPQGKSHLGMQSSQQIAAKLERTELPASAEEIKFISALIQNTDEVPLGITNAELDYLVTELAQRVSAAGIKTP